jgi:hydrogenase nickel incorporation protein HypA/HybF
MHELAIAQNIVKIAESEIAERGLQGTVERILFRAGRLHAIVPDILRFNFDVLTREAPLLKGATLDIEEIPIRVACASCNTSAVLEEPFFLCLSCGSPVTVEAGTEMFVERISIKEKS